MIEHAPALVLTDPRCVTSLLPHGITSGLITHHLFAHASYSVAARDDASPEPRITGDDYW